MVSWAHVPGCVYMSYAMFLSIPTVLTNDDAVRFVAQDTGPRATVAERLANRVIEAEAEAAGLGVSALLAVPPGRKRRQLHDDITGEWAVAAQTE